MRCRGRLLRCGSGARGGLLDFRSRKAYNKPPRLTVLRLYAKLFTSIYQGTLRGNSHGLLVFTNLLAHCDKDGIADIHPRAIAEEVGLTSEQVRAALDVLESPDDESRSPEEQGRRIIRMDEHRAWGWRVVNYAKYRAIRNEDDRREQNREAQARWREKNKQSKPASADGETDKPIQKQKQKQIQGIQGAGAVGDAVGAASLCAATPTPPAAFDGSNAEAFNGKTITTLAAGFSIPAPWGVDAEALGFKPAEVLREAEKFRQYWTEGRGKGTRRSVTGWRQTWSNWLEKAAKDKR